MSDSGWNTIDSDAGVFTELVEKLGIQDVQFDDLYSIDSDSLNSMSPLYGVVFLFKYGNVDRSYAKDGNKPLDGEYDTEYQSKGIFFANQIIQNACATQAVLNILLNVKSLDLGKDIGGFKSFVEGLDGEIIAEAISNSEIIRTVHNSFSAPNLIVDEDKPAPPPDYDDKNDGLFHFIGYVNIDNQIYELDGLKKYPIKHDKLQTPQEFTEKLPEILMRRIGKYGDELRFSLLGVTNDKLKYAQSIGDDSLLSSESLKRETWHRENELRRNDNMGLLVALLKNINKGLSDEEYEKLLNESRKKSQVKLLQQFNNLKK